MRKHRTTDSRDKGQSVSQSHAQRRALLARGRRLGFEWLEVRRLLTVSPQLSPPAAVTFLGNAADDQLHLRATSGVLEFSTDGIQYTADLDSRVAGVQSLTISPATQITVSLGGGNDTLYLDSSLIAALGSNGAGLTYDGGPGFDTLVVQGGNHQKVGMSATGPGSGAITFDGATINYLNIEPITLGGTASDVVITLPAADQSATLTSSAGQVTLQSNNGGFETTTFPVPSTSLTVDMNSGNDTFALGPLDPGFNAALTVDGQAGVDAVTVMGNVSLAGHSLTVNAEQITVNPGVTVTAGDITLNATAAVGTLVTPDMLPLATVAAAVDINGANLAGNNITLTASATLVSSVTNLAPNIPLVSLLANVSAEVAVTGNSMITASGVFTANAVSTVNSTVLANAVAGLVAADIGVGAPVINNTARSHVSGNSTVSAVGAVNVSATTNTTVNTTTTGVGAGAATGTTTAAPVITETTEAFIDGTASVTQSSSIDVSATANSSITTMSTASPVGGGPNPTRLSQIGAATAAGPQTDAAAIAATVLLANTRAYVTTAGSIVSSGAVTLTATPNHNVNTTANATPAVGANANGFAVATNVVTSTTEAFVGGNPTISAPALTIRTAAGSSTLTVLARSGAAGINNANMGPNAGALALNTNIILSDAYIQGGANLNLPPLNQTDILIDGQNSTIVDSSAEPDGAAVIGNLGMGRSVAGNLSFNTTRAAIRSGASIAGARNLTVTAHGNQNGLVTGLAGALATSNANSLTVAGNFSNNSSVALIDAGTTISLGGALTVKAEHDATTILHARSDAVAALNGSANKALATPLAVNLGNDLATTTVAGNVTAAGDINILANSAVQNQSEGVAGAAGADVNGTSSDSLVASEIAFLQNRANFVFGSAPVPPQSTPTTTVFTNQPTSGNAAALGFNLGNAGATANVTGTAVVTSSGGVLNVISTSDIDSNALASASTVNNLAGIAAAIAFDAQTMNTIASLGGAATANQIVVRTGMSGDGVHTLSADSTSGVGTNVAGLSGAVAITLALGTSNAFVANGATLTLAGGGNHDLLVQADTTIDNVANATPAVDMSITVGVGASAELNSGNFVTVAQIQNAGVQGARNVSVLSTGNYETHALAAAGASNDEAAAAALAAVISNNNTIANLTNSTAVSTITGDLVVTAHQVSTASYLALASSNAGDIGAGAAIAIPVIQGGAQSFAGNSMNVAGTVSVTANTQTFMGTDAVASQMGVQQGLPALLDQIIALGMDASGLGRAPLQFDPIAAVNGPADTLTIPNHGLNTGDAVIYTNNGDDSDNVGSLQDGLAYYVHKLTNNTFTLHGTFDDAVSGANPVNLEPASDADVMSLIKPAVPAAVVALINKSRGTGRGAVGAAAAAAANLDFSSALAGVAPGAVLNSGGAVNVHSILESNPTSFANAGNVNTGTGVGVAVAANIVSQVNQASIGGTVTAPTIDVGSSLGGGGVASPSAEAISGTGDMADTGVAGALALNLGIPLPIAPINIPLPTLPALPVPLPIPINLPTLPNIPTPVGSQQNAVILSGANLTLLNGGDLNVHSDYQGNYQATAHADTGGSVGVGPSAATNATTQQTLAEIQDATITGNQVNGLDRTDINVMATGSFRSTATADSGSNSSTGFPGAIALNYGKLDTIARSTNTTGTTNISGNLDIEAQHTVSQLHTASTNSAVSSGFGAAIAAGYSDGGAQASSGMRINVPTGTVTVLANNTSTLTANGTSGQSGASTAAGNFQVTKETVHQVEGLLAVAGLPEVPVNVVNVLERATAETADGPVGAAAALALNLDFGASLASLAPGGVVVVPAAPLVKASGHLGVDATADAHSVDAASGIGIAAAINVDGQRIETSIGGSVTAPSITVLTETSGDGINHFVAKAISGAGGADIGVAGAFALNVSADPSNLLNGTGGGQQNALIADGANLNIFPAGGNVVVTSNYVGDYRATATSLPASGPTIGIGPSVALNAINHTTRAQIGAALITGANDIDVTGNGTYTTTTHADAGANNSGALPAAIALTGASNDTFAQLMPGVVMSHIPGNLTVTANHVATTNTVADAKLSGLLTSQVGLGAAIAAGGPIGGGHAIAGPNLSVGGSVNVSANTSTNVHTNAFAAQAGVVATGISVDEQTQRQLKRLSVLTGLDPILFPFVDPNPPLQASFNPVTDVNAAADTITIATPHEFSTGDAVVYRINQDDTDVGDLLDQQTYFISVNADNPALVQLHSTRADALAGLNPVHLTPVPDFDDRHTLTAEKTFDPATAVDEGADTINLGNLSGLVDGDAVKYFNGGGTNIGGLTDGGLYYVHVDASNPNAITANFFATRQAALKNDGAIDLKLAGVTGTTHRVVRVVDAQEPLRLAIDPQSDVDAATNTIKKNGTAQRFVTGDTVVYHNNGDIQSIGALVSGNTYYVGVVNDANGSSVALQLYATRAQALTGQNPIALAPVASANVLHSLEPTRVIDPATSVDSDANTIDFGDFRSLSDGDAVVYRNGGSASIGGLVDGAVYYVASDVVHPSQYVFDPKHVGGETNAVMLGAGNSQGFQTGDRIVYDSNGGVAIGGLTSGNTYFLKVDPKDPGNVFFAKFYNSKDDAEADNNPITLDSGPATGTTHFIEHLIRVRLFEDQGLAKIANSSDPAVAATAVPIDLDGSVATGTAHRFEKVVVNHVDQRSLPNVQVGAAAAIGVGVNLAHSEAAIGPGGTIVADQVNVSSLLDLDSHGDADALSIVLAAPLSVGLALGGNYSQATNIAQVDDGAHVTANSVSLVAGGKNDLPDRYTANGASAALGLGGNLAGSLAVNAMMNHTAARIGKNATVNSATGVDVLANLRRVGPNFVDSGGVDSTARAGGVAFSLVAAAGAAAAGAVTVPGDLTEALIDDGANVTAQNGVDVRAKNKQTLDSQAVGGALSTLFAASLGAAFSSTNSEARAKIGAATVQTTTGQINVISKTHGDVNSFALGLTAGGIIAVGGAVTANISSNTTTAAIDGAGSVTSPTSVFVTASDDSALTANSAQLAASFVGAAGVSVAINSMTNTVQAYIAGSTVTAQNGNVDVSATSSYDVHALALGFSLAGAASFVGSITENSLNNTTDASLRDAATVVAQNEVLVHALDDSSVSADSGGLSASLGVGAGASLAMNKMAGTVRAGISGAKVTTNTGDVSVTAKTSHSGGNDVSAFALGFSVAGLAAGYGMAAINDVSNTTQAFIDSGANVHSADKVVLSAIDDSELSGIAAGLGASAFVGAGLSFASNTAANVVQAFVDGPDTIVDAVGTLDITGTSVPALTALAVAITLSPLLSASGAAAINDSKTKSGAGITGLATVTADTVSLHSTSKASQSTVATGLAAAGFAAGSVMVAESAVGDSARSEATGKITTNQLDVLADATRTPDAGLQWLQFALFTGEAAFVGGQTSGTTEALIGAGADIVITGGGNVNVKATSTDVADMNIVDPNFVAAFSIGGLTSFAAAGSNASAHVDGKVSANDVTVAASAKKTADASTIVIKFSLVSLNGILLSKISDGLPADLPIPIPVSFDTSAVSQIGGDESAYLGTGANVTTAAALSVTADSTNIANSNTDLGGATIVNVSNFQSEASIGGSTQMHIDSGATIDVDTLTSTAHADNTATAGGASAGVAGVDVSLADIKASTSHDVAAYLGPAAGQYVYNQPAGTLTVANGGITLSGTSINTPTVKQLDFDVSAVKIEKVNPQAIAGGSTRAQAGGNFTINAGAAGITAFADSTNMATSHALAFQINAFDLNLSQRAVQTTHVTEAFVTPQASLTVNGGPLTLTANSKSTATLDQTNAFDLSALNIKVVESTADAGGSTNAYVDEASTIHATALLATATSNNNAKINNFQFQISGIEIDATKPHATTSHNTGAFVGPAANVEKEFDPTDPVHAVDADHDTINLGQVAGTLATGNAVKYFNGGGANVVGLIDGMTYFVRVDSSDPSNVKVQLFTTRDNALNNSNAIDLKLDNISGQHHRLVKQEDQGTITVGAPLQLTATSTNDATIKDLTIGVSGFKIKAVSPQISTGGSTQVHVGGKYTFNAPGVTGQATATNSPLWNSLNIGITAVGVDVISPKVSTPHETDAFVGRNAAITENGGDITLGATSFNQPKLEKFDFSLGAITVNVFQPEVDADGATRAFVDEGASVVAANLSVTATATNTATIDMSSIGIAAVAVTDIEPTVKTTHDTEAYVGPRAGNAPTAMTSGTIKLGGGTLSVEATSHSKAEMGSMTIDLGLVTIGSVRPEVTSGGTTLAHLGGTFDITAGAVNVTAEAPNTEATTQTFSLDIGVANLALGHNPVTANDETEAFLAPAAHVTVSGGPLTFHATSGASATVDSLNITIGVASLAFLSADANVAGATKAYVGNGAVLNAGGVSLLADANNSASATQKSFGIALLGGVKLDPSATAQHGVEAYLDGGSDVTASGTLTVSATSTNTATASSNGTQGAIIGLADVNPHAIVQGDTKAHIDGKAQTGDLSVAATATRTATATASMISINVAGGGNANAVADVHGDTLAQLSGAAQLTAGGNAVFMATAIPTASARATGGGGGVINGASLSSHATIDGNTKAFADNNANVVKTANLEFHALSTATGSSYSLAGTGGVFSDSGADAKTDVNPTIQAFIGNDVQVQHAAGSIIIDAKSSRAEGDATAKVYGGGAIFVGAANSTVNSKPAVTAFIGSGSA
ncbi:MAG: hypothetical protein HY288_14015, partial [Planctomycetia bacterium]|nr:hypothetical protein [Planctomycetia bacterium]